VLVVAGCASVPAPLQGDYGAASPQQVEIGAKVRWGGSIIEVQTGKTDSCLLVLGKPLHSSSRPRAVDLSEGRFLACKAESFLDPEIFQRGREVTMVGAVDAFREHRIGKKEYQLPVVAVAELVLWPERTERQVIVEHPPFWGWPFCGRRFACW
jgi:outer membrane lipoprotein